MSLQGNEADMGNLPFNANAAENPVFQGEPNPPDKIRSTFLLPSSLHCNRQELDNDFSSLPILPPALPLSQKHYSAKRRP